MTQLLGLTIDGASVTEAGRTTGGTKVTEAGLKHLSRLANLRELRLRGFTITDAGLKNLAGLSQLRKLYLPSDAKVSDAGIAELKRAIQGLEVERW